MTRHRVAVIGLGKQGWRADQDAGRPRPRSHVSAWQTCPRAELVAIHDKDPRRVCTEPIPGAWMGIECLDLARVFERRPEIVSVATPPEAHLEIITTCVTAGVRLVVCEKPLADTAKAAAAIVEVCQESGTALLVNHGRRFHRLIRNAKRQINGGRIGPLRWASAWTSGGLWDNQIHMIDLLRFFLGEIGWVYATWKGPCGEQGEDGYVMTLHFTSGAYAVIHAGDIRRYVQSDLHLFGERGSLWLRQYGLGAIWYGVDGQYPLAGGYQRLVLGEASDVASPTTFLAEMAKHACDILEGTAEPWCRGEDGLAAVQGCEAAERSLAAGSMPIVPGAA